MDDEIRETGFGVGTRNRNARQIERSIGPAGDLNRGEVSLSNDYRLGRIVD
jgi:hypothetical protein